MKTLITAIGLSLLTGCATMFVGPTQTVKLESEPSGAKVYFRGELLGTTPATVQIPRSMDNPPLTFKKEGYVTHKTTLGKTIEGATLFNIAFISTTSGATSFGIDAGTGRMFRYSQDAYVIELEKGESALRRPALTPFEYTLVNFQSLQVELAQGTHGSYINGLCRLKNLDDRRCAEFIARLSHHRINLVKEPDALALYRAMDRI